MRVNDFLSLVLQHTEGLIPAELQPFTAQIHSVWLQIHYWTPKVHYEVWLTRKTGRIEIGLHFEGDREFNYRWVEVLAARMLEVQAALGPQVELEEWTSSWTRVHQTTPYDPLSEALAESVAGKLAATMVVMQPILEEERAKAPEQLSPALVALSNVRRSTTRQHFRSRRHRR